ncbi:MAG: DUF998 domain-containing protein [Spirochaetes bacterium]|jgi:hypothetical protein|nr:DUF998 domain-containing protein [Spirochaetota bacterium]
MKTVTRLYYTLIQKNESYILSYLAIRRLIGVLGMSLPVVVVTGGLFQQTDIMKSISAYYHTAMRDYFVGLVCAIAVFLVCYKGYLLLDNIVAGCAGLFALCVAFFPVQGTLSKNVRVGIFCLPAGDSEVVHVVCAALFFLTLACISLFLFTKDDGSPTSHKIKRNLIYRLSGIMIITSVLFIALFILFFPDVLIAGCPPVLFFEAFALMAFGISWLVKGETLFQDDASDIGK